MFQVFVIAGYSLLKILPKYYARFFGKNNHSSAIIGHITILREFAFGTRSSSHDEDNSQVHKIIDRADQLFLQQKYYDTYQLLNAVFDRYNSDVLWRIGRVLFSIASNEILSYSARKDLIYEAYHLVQEAEQRTKTNFEIYKWLAILLKAKSDYSATTEKLKQVSKIKDYLTAALKLNSSEITTLYLLGHWNYQIASLTWFQKKIAAIYYCVILPEGSFHEAYACFSKIEALKPNYFVTNTTMLAKTCYRIKKFEEAQHYYNIIEVLSYRIHFELCCMDEIKKNYNSL